MAEAPTAVQLSVLREIFAAVEKRGYPPTIRELCDKIGVNSTNAVSEHLKALKKKGLIERVEKISRGIKVTQRGRDFVTGRAA